MDSSSTQTINHSTLAYLAEAGVITSTDIVGQPGGWEVVIKYGMTERALSAKRGAVRVFKRFETLVSYLKCLGITEYRVNATNYDQEAGKLRIARPDSAERLKRAHEAAAHDTWLKTKVAASLAGIDDGSNSIISDGDWAAERAQWQREAQAA